MYIYIYIYPDQGDDLEEVTDERPRVGQNEFRVICGALSGMLHKSRFASGIRVYLSTYSRLPIVFLDQNIANLMNLDELI